MPQYNNHQWPQQSSEPPDAGRHRRQQLQQQNHSNHHHHQQQHYQQQQQQQQQQRQQHLESYLRDRLESSAPGGGTDALRRDLRRRLAGCGWRDAMGDRARDAVRRLLDGGGVTIGGRAWRCIDGHGHAPEHIAMYCEELNVLIAGDMMLPRISTNVGVWPNEPQANPLKWFLDAHARCNTE